MSGDAYYQNVSLLLHCDGSDGSTTFADSGPSARSVTAVGNAHIEVDQYKFGTASGYFDGSGDYLNCGDHTDFELGSGEFTLEAWVRLTAYSGNFGGYYGGVIFGKDAATGRSFQWKITGTSSSWTGMSFSTAGSEITASYTFSLNTWYHVAVCKSGTTLRFFVDGTQIGTNATHNSTIANVATALTVGGILYATVELQIPAFLDDLRFTKGAARYTSNFTPPAAAFPNYAGQIGGTVLDDAGDPVARTVRAYRRDTGALVGNTTSSAADGSYSMNLLTLDECTVLCLDDAGGDDFNDLALRVTPA